VKADTLKKVKKDDLPKDSLGIFLIQKETLITFADVKSFNLPEDSDKWIAIQFEKLKKPKEEKKEKDTTKTVDTTVIAKEKEVKPSKAKKEGTDLLLLEPSTGKEFRFTNVDSYTADKSGNRFAFVSLVDDSVDTAYVVRFDVKSLKTDTLTLEGLAKSPVLSDDGKNLAFLFSKDTATVKYYDLYLWGSNDSDYKILVDSLNSALKNEMRVSINYDINFSDSGERLFFGIAKTLRPEPEETLLDEEKANVEVWGWNDPLIHPQQNFELSREKKKTFLMVYHLSSGQIVQLTDSLIENVSFSRYTDNQYALGASSLPYKKLISWDDGYSDIYSVDILTGERKLVKQKQSQLATISPKGKYLVWYDEGDSSYYSYENATGKSMKISGGIDQPLYDVENDVPDQPGAYGISGWFEDDKSVTIRSQFDEWLIDPKSNKPPRRMSEGKEINTVFRIIDVDKKLPWFPEQELIYFSVFDQTTKQNGFASYNPGSAAYQIAKIIVKSDNVYNFVTKAQNSEDFILSRESHFESPNIYYSYGLEGKFKQISDINPQQSEYLWSEVQLVKYHSIDGKPLEGMLFTPKNLDKSKKYPMMVYFYERDSYNLNRYWSPSPSRSIINPVFYASNQYVVFIPDIVYEEGFPGKSAYNCIVGGTLSMLEQFPYIDRTNIALQGQSWGGYQTAFLITQTNLYKAAMAGAPVSNMTSAYGGIRWGSGLVRQFQYEKGQSRIGGSLWEKQELYIANSPLFFLDRVNTPLLIMANDKDDAVPWYQGIELYAGLRRLEKPVWMLNYTGDVHNIKEANWGNRVDLSKRMLQFFDHYLKGAPAPKWMTEGVPAINRDKDSGY
jgi:dipeptidyl aminopeptidase/acylaminoacyl peptidase